jgi:hypothetical protein
MAGNYGVFKVDELLKNISFNYSRTESASTALSENLLDDYSQKETISAVFDTLQFERTNSEIWKWFVALTLLFLVLEVLIQKFVK